MRKAMRRAKRTKVKTPSGVTKWVVKKKRVSHTKCGNCGEKINRARLNKSQISKLTKSQKRPTRPYPELCSRCMRAKIKTMVK